MMRRAMVGAIFAIFVLGVLFPVSRTSEGKSHFLQAIKDVFHYFPNEQSPAAKETPAKFEGTVKKQLRYPETKQETK